MAPDITCIRVKGNQLRILKIKAAGIKNKVTNRDISIVSMSVLIVIINAEKKIK